MVTIPSRITRARTVRLIPCALRVRMPPMPASAGKVMIWWSKPMVTVIRLWSRIISTTMITAATNCNLMMLSIRLPNCAAGIWSKMVCRRRLDACAVIFPHNMRRCRRAVLTPMPCSSRSRCSRPWRPCSRARPRRMRWPCRSCNRSHYGCRAIPDSGVIRKKKQAFSRMPVFL